MKKQINVLMFAGLALSLLGCTNNQPTESSSITSESSSASEKSVHVYWNSLNSGTTTTLRFYDKAEQIPYIELEEAFRLRKALFDTGTTYETPGKSTYKVSNDGSKYTVTLNNRSSATFDVEKQTFYIQNLGLLQAYSYNDTPYDILPFDTSDTSKIKYVTHQTRGSGVKSSYYPGLSITIPLGDYNVPIYEENSKAYIPLDLFNNFFVSYTYSSFVYNTKNIYVFSQLSSTSTDADYTAKFYSENTSARTKELAEFSYNSLRLNLDYQYGLSAQHGFSDFKTEFKNFGIEEGLLSTDGTSFLFSLYNMIYGMFGDGHCSMGSRSSYINETQENEVKSTFKNYNIGIREINENSQKAAAARKTEFEEHPEYNKPYYVDGDTAYVTFDSFSTWSTIPDYYTKAPMGSETDTFGVISYANKMIKSDSNIKNVVVDVSCNGGGEEIALIFALGWMLGDDAKVSVQNPLTHCNSTTYYHADVNLDGKYDEKDDTLEGYNKFILTSKGSYSCANALPCLAQNSNKVKIIGQTSGGGTCQVFPLVTTDGTIFNVSGGAVLCTESNSHYEDIDAGATPDFAIADLNKMWDRSYTTKVVQSMVI